jgi:hypothetical protein
LELYQQTNARLWRQGQQSPDTVVIQHIITKGTIDERILKALSKKELTQSALIDAVKAGSGGATMTRPYENLINAIILQAVKDYRDALKAPEEKTTEYRLPCLTAMEMRTIFPFCLVSGPSPV